VRSDLLFRLEEERRLRPGARAAEEALESALAFVPRDATELARLHDAALCLRVYPQSPRVLALAETLLARVPAHVARLADEGADLAPLDDPSVAGIAGVPVAMPFSHAAASWLARRDDDPFFTGRRGRKTATDGGFAELNYFPLGQDGRWVLTALYNYIDSDLVEVRRENASLTLTYLLARNLKVLGELYHDFERDDDRLLLGFVTAF